MCPFTQTPTICTIPSRLHTVLPSGPLSPLELAPTHFQPSADSDDYSGPPEPPPSEDTLGPDQWRGGTAEQWEQFLREARVRDCTFWDAQNVDQGFPPTHVDLERE